jgi:hypothetical protein
MKLPEFNLFSDKSARIFFTRQGQLPPPLPLSRTPMRFEKDAEERKLGLEAVHFKSIIVRKGNIYFEPRSIFVTYLLKPRFSRGFPEVFPRSL